MGKDKNSMVTGTLWVVHSIVRRYPPQYREELTAVGYLALCEAARCFKASFKTKFGTYAYMVVKRAITRSVREETEWRGQTASVEFAWVLKEAEACSRVLAGAPEASSLSLSLSLVRLTEQEETVLVMLRSGASYQDVADEFGVTRSRVGQIVAGIRRRAANIKSP